MRPLTAAHLLGVWEQGLDRSLPQRALLLTAAVSPDAADADLAGLTVGRRDDLLMRLREHLFGPVMTVVATCPACGAALESDVRLADLAAAPPAAGGEFSVTVDGRTVVFHLPTAGDLLDLPPDPAAARATIALRAVSSIDGMAGPDAAQLLTEPAMAAMADVMAAADPQADVELLLMCPSCGHEWQDMFDIASALWTEIHAWARGTVREVHALARAYGWREPDILALTPTRRRMYIELSQP